MSKSIFGNRLALARTKKGLTQAELTARINSLALRKKDISTLTVSAWETGRKSPTLSILVVLCDILCVTPDYLLGFSSPYRPQSEDSDDCKQDILQQYGTASLTMSQLMRAEKVWISITSKSPLAKGATDGWYHHSYRDNEKLCLVNDAGHTLPYDQLNISYSAYSSNF